MGLAGTRTEGRAIASTTPASTDANVASCAEGTGGLVLPAHRILPRSAQLPVRKRPGGLLVVSLIDFATTACREMVGVRRTSLKGCEGDGRRLAVEGRVHRLLGSPQTGSPCENADAARTFSEPRAAPSVVPCSSQGSVSSCSWACGPPACGPPISSPG